MNFIYILECTDGTYYTGWTNNLEKRVLSHNEKKGAKYTRSRVPAYIRYYEIYEAKVDAQKREYQIKQYSRNKKKELIENFNDDRINQINEIIKKIFYE